MEDQKELLHNSEIRAPILLSQHQQQQQQQLVEKDRKAPTRPQKEQALHCPRCNSTNTKFCYYNNYSLTQPRYFCKTCRRYWTAGGSLRNVPVGGGSRKNKRHSTSNSAKIPPPPPLPPQQDSIQDLNLALIPNHHGFDTNNSGGGISAMEMLRSGVGPMMSMMPIVPPDRSGVLHGNGLYNFDGRVVFPFGELKQEQHRGQLQAGDPTMFWNGMNMGGGSGSW